MVVEKQRDEYSSKISGGISRFCSPEMKDSDIVVEDINQEDIINGLDQRSSLEDDTKVRGLYH